MPNFKVKVLNLSNPPCNQRFQEVIYSSTKLVDEDLYIGFQDEVCAVEVAPQLLKCKEDTAALLLYCIVFSFSSVLEATFVL